VLGEALEACFGVRLTIGPAIEEGFYYDCYMGDRTLTDAERPLLEKKIEQVCDAMTSAVCVLIPGCRNTVLVRALEPLSLVFVASKAVVRPAVLIHEPCCCAQITKEKQPFQRVVVTREEALAMFQENKFKVEIISGLPQDATISLYRCGPMVDLCHGPHLPNTGYLKASAVNAFNRAFWRADITKEPLQVRTVVIA
jgi:threonyl-tRNA synthetase